MPIVKVIEVVGSSEKTLMTQLYIVLIKYQKLFTILTLYLSKNLKFIWKIESLFLMKLFAMYLFGLRLWTD